MPSITHKKMVIVELSNINKFYRDGNVSVSALKNISLTVRRGDFMCIAGPSGSGKSTLLHIAGTLDVPSSGSVSIDGMATNNLSRTSAAMFRRQNIGFIFQRFNLIPVLTAFENVEYTLSLQGVSKKERCEKVEHVLSAVGLADFMTNKAGNLSGGQQQRVAVARAIVSNPKIILADEPTGSLDSETGSALIDLLKSMNRKQATTFLISSHDPRVMGRADKTVHLRDGQFV